MDLRTIRSTFLKDSDLHSEEERRILFSMVLDQGLSIDRMKQLSEPHLLLSPSQIEFIHKANADLKLGKPIQQILGKTYFFHMDLEVNEHTLIPRPETEELLELIQKENEVQPTRALDIGTGSGCIALGLKLIYPQADITGIDLSEEALLVAQRNAISNSKEVHFERLDILNFSESNIDNHFDLIVSNPPYIAFSEKDSMSKTVNDFEPHLALFVEDSDPLKFYEAIEGFSKQYLKEEGRIYLEINQHLGSATQKLYMSRGWQTTLYKDMSGNDRFLKVWA